MHRYLVLSLSWLGLAISRAIETVDRFIAAVLVLFEPRPQRMFVAGPALQLDQSGTPLAPALRNSLRFESMTARIGAPRNT